MSSVRTLASAYVAAFTPMMLQWKINPAGFNHYSPVMTQRMDKLIQQVVRKQ